MTAYQVEFTAAAAKEVRKLDAQIRRRILAGIAELEREPRPHGVRKLAGYENAWRLRVGDYRVLYEISDEKVLVTVVRVAHRRDVYGDL
ncbi:type II toxin-antitoxin system RelE family toxin [Microbacterium sp.]|uniref:type II toxin-antitoxin system RelE family toxin n=1 Tax=Microbacterium sp. TaxID=51671 RepID=UPI0039E48763